MPWLHSTKTCQNNDSSSLAISNGWELSSPESAEVKKHSQNVLTESGKGEVPSERLRWLRLISVGFIQLRSRCSIGESVSHKALVFPWCHRKDFERRPQKEVRSSPFAIDCNLHKCCIKVCRYVVGLSEASQEPHGISSKIRIEHHPKESFLRHPGSTPRGWAMATETASQRLHGLTSKLPRVTQGCLGCSQTVQ